ncbi:MAG: alpha-L-fucosidase precursor [Armatimonadia bacterium]|nr:alpha-L-fucosidase precursor [Armatimonadia bacterium]
MKDVPSFLKGYEHLYTASPREATLAWSRDARYGLFLHYGLYSLLGRHEWVQYREKIPVVEYGRLIEDFHADQFDADAIAQLAVDAGMKYINITSRHHESFSLWDTAENDFSAPSSPAGRDLIAELAEACARRGLGFFLYYSHGRDWKHRHAPNNDEWGGAARPHYDPPDPAYAYGDEHDLDIYLEFMWRQITELLEGYGPIAGIWLDGIAVPLSGDESRFRCQELYDHIHAMQPQVLVSYKQGLLGTEDFVAPEHKAVDRPREKPGEICTTLDPGSWGYMADGGPHLGPDEVWEKLRQASAARCNLLLNTGPLPSGAIETRDADTLRAVGERLAREGFPE